MIEEDLVASIVIHLDEPLPPENIVEQLKLEEFHSMVIHGDLPMDGEVYTHM